MDKDNNTITTADYQHIDNGGVNIKVGTEFENNNSTTSITISNSYFDYPQSSLTLSMFNKKDALGTLKLFQKVISEHIEKIENK